MHHSDNCNIILALPNITKQPLSTICKIHTNSCELECFATGIGHIQYKWEKYQSSSNSWIRPFHRAVNVISPKLMFSVITEEDEGVYHCIATNRDGSVVSNSATITVYGKSSFCIYKYNVAFIMYICRSTSHPLHHQ